METEKIYQLAVYAFKTVILVVLMYLIFNFGFFINKKINNILPKLPKFVLYILIAILSVGMLLLKLMNFGIIKT